MENRDESHWYDNPWLIGTLVVLVLLAASYFLEGMGPAEAEAAEAGIVTDSLAVECGTVTRSHYLGDTLRVWIEGEDGKTRGPFQFINGLEVESKKVYVITFYRKSRVVHRTDPPPGGRCPTPAEKAGFYFDLDFSIFHVIV